MGLAQSSNAQGRISTSWTAIVLTALLMLSSSAWGSNNNPLLVGGPNSLPVGKLGPAKAAAPAGAHLTYYGGRVVSNLHVIQVLWGSGTAGGRQRPIPDTGPQYHHAQYRHILPTGPQQRLRRLADRVQYRHHRLRRHPGDQPGHRPRLFRNPGRDHAVQHLQPDRRHRHPDRTDQPDRRRPLTRPHHGRRRQQQHLLCDLLPARDVDHSRRDGFLRSGWILRVPRHDPQRQFRILLRCSSRPAGRFRMRHRMRRQHRLRKPNLSRLARDGRDDY